MSSHEVAAGTQAASQAGQRDDRRHGYMVSPQAQGRFRAQILGLALVVSLIALGLTTATTYLVDHKHLLDGPMVPIWLALTTLALCAGIVRLCDRISHRVAGPAHRLRCALEAVQRGETLQPVVLRDGDELHDLAEALNATLQQLGVMQSPPGDRDSEGDA
jgi:hypothetical protein